MRSTGKLVVLVMLVSFLLGATAFAERMEWRDPNYNFGVPRFILIMEPQFSYDGYEEIGRNKFNRYPYAAEKTNDMLNARLQGLSRHRIVNMDYVMNQIKADSTLTEPFDPKAAGFTALVQREMGKHVDLILYLDVRDFGWFYEYHGPYTTTETYTERVYYSRRHRDGTETSGWEDIPRTRIVHHPAGYNISDCAGAAFRLYDAKTGRDVWKYSDSRIRKSPSISQGYDPSGPQSMMKRIFEDAFKKMPLVR